MDKRMIATAARKLTEADTTLIVIGQQATADTFAAALALHLLARAKAQTSTVVAAQLPTVELSAIAGIDQVTAQLPTPNLVITLDDAVGAVEKVSYFVEGTQLKLVVHPSATAPQFDPQHIHIFPGVTHAKTTVLFAAASEADLQPIYKDQSLPADSNRVVIAAGHGTLPALTALVDPNRASDSEIVAQLIEEMGWPEDESAASDIAHNLLTGIRHGTRDFTDTRVSPETFEIAARLSRKMVPVAPPPWMIPEVKEAGPVPAATEFPTEVPIAQLEQPLPQQTQPVEPEPDWLTPKIYKGTSLL